MIRSARLACAAALAAAGAAPALAHARTGGALGFRSGFLHPLSGWDHVLAMVAVGLWGAQLGPPAIWLLPVAFPMVMAVGGVLGILGVPLPGAEVAVALSAVVLGGAVLAAARPPLVVAGVLVGLFGLFHGYAHGAELPPGHDALAYSCGFLLATGLLHATGILVGALARGRAGALALRALGLVVLGGGGAVLAAAVR